MANIPNWCNAMVKVSGEPKNVEDFCRLFIFDKEDVLDKYFARSFVHETWKDFKKESLDNGEAQFSVDFAWSCWSCMFEGYPNKEECVTLKWAVKKFNVLVEINTEEGGMGFEEYIETINGEVEYSSKEIPSYECRSCGNKQLIADSYDINEEECCECGKIAWEDELVEVIKQSGGVKCGNQ